MINEEKKWLEAGCILETHKLPETNPFDPEYPSWGTEDRSINLLKSNWDTYIVFTNGYAYEDNNVEFFIESDEIIEDFDSSWQKNLVYETCRNIVYIDDLDSVLEETEFLILQLDMDGAPAEWSYEHKDGNIGLFIGLQNEKLPFNEGIKALNIKLMRPLELKYAIENGVEARKELAELYKTKGNGTLSSMTRKSVI